MNGQSPASMLAVRLIPCLDVQEGRVVKGVNFVNLRDTGDPVEQAKVYDAAGADELCFLDISATHEGRKTLFSVVEQTAEACFMPLTVGGGVRALDDLLAAKAQAHRGFDGIISGRALYDGRLDPKQALEALAALAA